MTSRDEATQKSDPSEKAENTLLLAKDLLERCQTLVDEIKQLQSFLISQRKENSIDVRAFQSHVNAELRSLEKYSVADPAAEHTTHALHSSNFPFHSTLWDAAKTTRGLTALSKRFFWEPGLKRQEKQSGKRKKQSALVDIVAENGKQWIKVSTVTESRLLFDLAKAGWERDSEASASDEGSSFGDSSTQKSVVSASDAGAEDEVEIVRLAHDLHKASQATYVDYEHPEIVFLLPRLPKDGTSAEIDRILTKVKVTGAKVRCGPIKPLHVSLQDLLRRMVISNTGLTPTLNIDCTILLALVSDLSHCFASDLLQRSDAPQYHPVIRKQIAGEEQEALLPQVLYPILDDRRLVCTQEAAKRMREIVSTMGTVAERARTDIFIGKEGTEESTRSNEGRTAVAAKALQELSIHATPSLRLPIEIVDSQPSFNASSLPTAAAEVGSKLSALNRSVFFYGWAEDITTITSNKVVTTEIEQMIIDLKKRNAGDQKRLKGPKLWICDTARSLVGKEKGRKIG